MKLPSQGVRQVCMRLLLLMRPPLKICFFANFLKGDGTPTPNFIDLESKISFVLVEIKVKFMDWEASLPSPPDINIVNGLDTERVG